MKLSENAFTVAIPIRIPVKEPGPISQINKSISFKVKLVSSNISLIIGIKDSECVKPLLSSIFLSNLLSSKIATAQILLEVSMHKVFKVKPPYILF